MQHNKVECMLVLKRIYDAPVERLWKAWTDPAGFIASLDGCRSRHTKTLAIGIIGTILVSRVPCSWVTWRAA